MMVSRDVLRPDNGGVSVSDYSCLMFSRTHIHFRRAAPGPIRHSPRYRIHTKCRLSVTASSIYFPDLSLLQCVYSTRRGECQALSRTIPRRAPAPRSRLDDRRPGTSPMRTKIGPLFAQTNVPLQGRDRPAVGPAWRRRGDSPFASWGLPILDLCCIIPIVRGLSSAVECLLAKEKVKGSNPLAPLSAT